MCVLFLFLLLLKLRCFVRFSHFSCYAVRVVFVAVITADEDVVVIDTITVIFL